MKSSGSSVLSVVLESDVERNQLLQRINVLNKALQSANQDEKESSDSAACSTSSVKTTAPVQGSAPDSSNATFASMIAELGELQERLDLIGADSAEARAARILSGNQRLTCIFVGVACMQYEK